MKITNDHYQNFPDTAWTREDSKVYLTAEDGSVWAIGPDARTGGLEIRALGKGIGDDQLVVLSRAGNTIAVRAERP